MRATHLIPRPIRRRLKPLIYGKPIIQRLVDQYCVGQGLEIGAGKTPCCSPRNTVFLDKHTNNKDGTPNADIVADANSIPVADGEFDFVFSSHVLEHCQNTICTLNEWTRVLRLGGVLFLVLPHGDRTFDRCRPKTSLEHHIQDFERLTDAPDYSHVEEITAGWSEAVTPSEMAEYEREWGAKMWDWDFRFKNDVIHFHVWTQDEIVRLLQYLRMKICHVEECVSERPDSFIVVAVKN